MCKAGGTVSTMGEIATSSRPRKDLAASFHRMKRMVVDVKSARKSLVAHHSFVAELVSVAFYSSSKVSLPCNHLHRDDPQEEALSLAVSSSNSPAQSPRLPSQPHDLQEAGIETQSSLPSSPPKTPENPLFLSLRGLVVNNSTPFPTSPGEISRISKPHKESDSGISPTSATYPDDHGQAISGSNLGKSSTVHKDVFFCSSDPQAPSTRSRSFPGRFKLSVILVLALIGLAYSHFVAVCLCSCCLFLLASMQGLAIRVYRLKS